MKKQDALINIPKKVNIIGVPISAVNMKSAIEFTIENLENLKGQYICASNVHTTVMAHDDKEYLKAQSESIMSLPDGKPLSVVGRKKGYKEMEKTTGYHYMQNILTDERLKNKKHFFLGSTKENLEIMQFKLKEQYPNINIVGCEPSKFREITEEEFNDLVNLINKSKADFLWIGTGAPRQEKLMNKLKNKVNCLMIGIGGAFNIISGKVNDAPMWMQNIGMEWFYRFLKEPKRLFKRYFITNTKFIVYSFNDRSE